MIALPDVNVLPALVWSNHPHHELAHEWFGREASSGWATCLLTQSAFVRLSLNPQVVGAAIECAAALQMLEGLVAHPQHRYVEILPSLSDLPFTELSPRVLGYRQVSDAVLLHVVRSHGMRLITFDHAVARICPWRENLLALSPHRPETTLS